MKCSSTGSFDSPLAGAYFHWVTALCAASTRMGLPPSGSTFVTFPSGATTAVQGETRGVWRWAAVNSGVSGEGVAAPLAWCRDVKPAHKSRGARCSVPLLLALAHVWERVYRAHRPGCWGSLTGLDRRKKWVVVFET